MEEGTYMAGNVGSARTPVVTPSPAHPNAGRRKSLAAARVCAPVPRRTMAHRNVHAVAVYVSTDWADGVDGHTERADAEY